MATLLETLIMLNLSENGGVVELNTSGDRFITEGRETGLGPAKLDSKTLGI